MNFLKEKLKKFIESKLGMYIIPGAIGLLFVLIVPFIFNNLGSQPSPALIGNIEEESQDLTDDLDIEKLMESIKYVESQRYDEAAEALIAITDEEEYYENPYIKHIGVAVEGYLNGTNNGVEEGALKKSELEDGLRCGLDSFDKGYFKSDFIVFAVEKNVYGGIVAYIGFLDRLDTVFWTYIFKYAGEEYTLRAICEYAALIPQT